MYARHRFEPPRLTLPAEFDIPFTTSLTVNGFVLVHDIDLTVRVEFDTCVSTGDPVWMVGLLIFEEGTIRPGDTDPLASALWQLFERALLKDPALDTAAWDAYRTAGGTVPTFVP
jgi:hypothetical protein